MSVISDINSPKIKAQSHNGTSSGVEYTAGRANAITSEDPPIVVVTYLPVNSLIRRVQFSPLLLYIYNIASDAVDAIFLCLFDVLDV